MIFKFVYDLSIGQGRPRGLTGEHFVSVYFEATISLQTNENNGQKRHIA